MKDNQGAEKKGQCYVKITEHCVIRYDEKGNKIEAEKNREIEVCNHQGGNIPSWINAKLGDDISPSGDIQDVPSE